MKMRYIVLMVGLCAGTLYIHKVRSERKQMDSRFQNASATDLFRIIDALKVAAFASDSLIRSGIDINDVNNWNNALMSVQGIIMQGIKDKQLPVQFNSYFDVLKKSSDQLINIVDTIHNSYSTIYVKFPTGVSIDQGKLRERNRLRRQNNLGPFINKAVLNSTLETIDGLHEQVDVIAQEVEGYIVSSTPPAGVYDDAGTLKNANQILKKYKKFLHEYDTQIGEETNKLKNFLSAQGIDTVIKARTLMMQLNQMEYIMDQKLKMAGGDDSYKRKIMTVAERLKLKKDRNRVRKENLGIVAEMLIYFDLLYPREAEYLGFQKIMASTNKPAISLFTIASALEPTLKKVANEIRQLLAVAGQESA